MHAEPRSYLHLTIAGLDRATKPASAAEAKLHLRAGRPPRVGAVNNSFRSRVLATGWPALRPAMVTNRVCFASPRAEFVCGRRR